MSYDSAMIESSNPVASATIRTVSALLLYMYR
jgi:hypothetical protein